VGEGLKTQVHEALRHLAQGFLDHGPNGLTAAEADLKAIYDHSLIVLYRLLFVFYAEARELLPLVDSPAYRDRFSLRSITRQVSRDVAAGDPLLSDSALMWPRLRQLFTIINAGSPPLKVATFNGGLFDPARYPFLQTNFVGDAHLEAALDRLALLPRPSPARRQLADRRAAVRSRNGRRHEPGGRRPQPSRAQACPPRGQSRRASRSCGADQHAGG